MAYIFHDVVVFAFDIHTAISALESAPPGQFQPRFQFLTDPAQFNPFYRGCRDVNLPGFGFRPVPATKLISDHFWSQYISMAGNKDRDFWRIQMPLICHPKRTKLALRAAPVKVQITIRPEVFLSPMGWSTNIRIGFRGNMTWKQTVELVQAVMDRSVDTPFLIGTDGARLTEVFQYYQRQVVDAVFQGAGPPHPPTKIPRYFVVSINHFEGPVKRYRTEMTRAERARIESLLYGRQIGYSEEGSRPLTLTTIDDPNFALTDFDHGTLVFAQTDALKLNYARKLHCLASNIQKCMMMAFSQLQFLKLANRGSNSPLLTAMRDNALDTLHRFPESYCHPFCTSLFLNHLSLAEISKPS